MIFDALTYAGIGSAVISLFIILFAMKANQDEFFRLG